MVHERRGQSATASARHAAGAGGASRLPARFTDPLPKHAGLTREQQDKVVTEYYVSVGEDDEAIGQEDRLLDVRQGSATPQRSATRPAKALKSR